MKNKETITIPFTYSIYHKSSDRWYYGVKYADQCKPSDLGVNYFSSSPVVKDLIKEFGINDFIFKVRKIFKDKKKAIDWESRFLLKIRSSNIRHKFLNKCFAPSFWPIMYGDLNPSKTTSSRKKLSEKSKSRSKTTNMLIGKKVAIANTRNNILKLINIVKKYRGYLNYDILRDLKILNLVKINNHIKFLVKSGKKFKTILKIYSDILLILETPKIKAPYPAGVKRNMSIETRALTNEKIANKHYNTVYAENIFTKERKKVKIEQIGDIWIQISMHTDESLEKISEAAKNCSTETREKLSNIAKISRANSKYYTSPDLLYYKSFKLGAIIPDGWIPGIKVESRNKKIGENNRWSTLKDFDEKDS